MCCVCIPWQGTCHHGLIACLHHAMCPPGIPLSHHAVPTHIMPCRAEPHRWMAAGLSTWLPLRNDKVLLSDANKDTPVFMGHGNADPVVRVRALCGHTTPCTMHDVLSACWLCVCVPGMAWQRAIGRQAGRKRGGWWGRLALFIALHARVRACMLRGRGVLGSDILTLACSCARMGASWEQLARAFRCSVAAHVAGVARHMARTGRHALICV